MHFDRDGLILAGKALAVWVLVPLMAWTAVGGAYQPGAMADLPVSESVTRGFYWAAYLGNAAVLDAALLSRLVFGRWQREATWMAPLLLAAGALWAIALLPGAWAERHVFGPSVLAVPFLPALAIPLLLARHLRPKAR